MTGQALLDSNVLIAILVEAHQHHGPSLALLNRAAPMTFAVAAHSYAETYNTLTRDGPRALFAVPPRAAWAAIQSLRETTRLVGLTPARTFDAIRQYAHGGGVGPRLYDRLIGEVAIAHGLEMIVTWNIGHMAALFPDLAIVNPREASLAR